MGKRAENKIKNEKEILGKAINLFIRKGDQATTISDIVAETNLAFGTFYNYFRNKNEIWDKIIADFMLAHTITEQRHKSQSIYDFIYYTLDPIIAASEVYPFRQLMANNPAAFRDAYFRTPVIETNIYVFTRDMQSSDLFKGLPEVYYKMNVYAILGACFEILVQSYQRNDNISKEQMLIYIASIFENGLVGIQRGNKNADTNNFLTEKLLR